MTTKAEFMEMLAAMDDKEFESFVASFGFTIRPESSGGETMSNFRERVVEYLRGPAPMESDMAYDAFRQRGESQSEAYRK